MTLRRRDFISFGALTLATGMLAGASSCKGGASQDDVNSTGDLKPMTGDVVPISKSEREARIAKAQRLLIENKMDALVLESGTGLRYFTGISWWPSERTMAAVIPAKGDIKYVCPAFEEARFREQITIGNKVYTWQEDESPYHLISTAIKDSGIAFGTVGIEESVRFFIADGIRKDAPNLSYVSGDPVTIPCRRIKSAAEIKLMQKANDITLAAIKHGVSQLKEGMSQNELASIIMAAQNHLGGAADFALCLFGASSAFPHGSKQPQTLKKGDIVLMDCGCVVDGYNSDITRTVVFGAEPTKRQQQIWELEKKAQDAGFAAAKIGEPCEAVDAAARKVITDAGFGPGYKLPGLPHRTGHGIGMDGHEWGNMVKGNKLLIQPGMCFSIEPTIAIPGEFGVRLEDCVYMTEEGPKWFSKTSKSIQEPFG
ncbi:Xaa-Pro peptidase family protein [Mucilaginibacter sp. L3T2-6]|uniref:M24 family metallopeptidase n=1 Tax=Mucilaginibacter sp. L3T2-6 TaxID=3062491 RepID=UPI002676921D|nr:Xaa-Pro peptidase family protein [Mucilaginibacter sp. L3T2-6]MDO3644370.1 Xaa-Pro peptidase family protein [Mucilaginibacter sp. L3T2-6]MDV6216822.1 Xaa-Pro peptidase family protein [Mucilaginibacter sp. L3T2-6]